MRKSKSRSLKAPAWTDESTWMTPMIRSRDHSGALMAERMPWMRIESPTARRSSTWAS